MKHFLKETILNTTLKATRLLFSSNPVHTKIMRKIFDQSSKLLKMDKGFSAREVKINHLNALWIEQQNPKIKENIIILYFHGGGFHIGSPKSYKRLLSKICNISNAKALLIDYRKAPEYHFPAPNEDALTSYEYLLNEGYKPSHIIIGGDSAGGNITLSLLLQIKKKKLKMPVAAFVMSPFVDHTLTAKSIETNSKKDPLLTRKILEDWSNSYLTTAIQNRTAPEVSPLFANLKGLPPLLIQVGTEEVLEDDAKNFHNKAIQDKVNVRLEIYKGKVHVFQLFDIIDDTATKAIKSIGSFINEFTEK